jgi:putative ABC transport system substrate-binding protein
VGEHTRTGARSHDGQQGSLGELIHAAVRRAIEVGVAKAPGYAVPSRLRVGAGIVAPRLVVIVSLTFTLLATPLAAPAQPVKVPRIGVLRAGAPPDPNVEGFREGLRELGYVEGQNVVIEYRWAEGKPDRLAGLALELVRLKVDVIVTGGGQATQAAMSATSTLPIVTGAAGSPATGLVASLARPGGNVTGLTVVNVELSAKKVELLREALPKVSRVAILGDPTNPSYELVLKESQRAAQLLRIQLQAVEVRNPNELEGAFAAMTRGRAGAFIHAPSELFFAYRRRLLDLAAKSRLPGVSDTRDFVDRGGFMSYGPSLPQLFRRAATYVDRILKGAKPADLPIEQPTTFELVINVKTAKALGLTIPPAVLARADQVIQ